MHIYFIELSYSYKVFNERLSIGVTEVVSRKKFRIELAVLPRDIDLRRPRESLNDLKQSSF